MSNFNNLSRIIEGFDCSLEDYPYVVTIMLRIFYIHVCGGSAVNPFWVLTAAHCCFTYGENLLIISGSPSRTDIERSQAIVVSACHRHPEHRGVANDVALLRLKEELHENEKIQYVSLSSEAFTPSFINSCRNSLVMGYGQQTKRTLKGVTTSPTQEDNKLKCANISVISDGVCDRFVHRHIGHFCAMDLSDSFRDVCDGDSGGPLMCNGKQIGIVSAGYGCGQGLPALYTKVSSYLEFIEYVIANRSMNELGMKGMILLFSLFFRIM